MTSFLSIIFFTVLFVNVNAFLTSTKANIYRINRSQLFMGRAAAVRANTKAKTDAAKAKNNGRFVKKIIMAVKAGGTDVDTNRQLAQVL